MRGSLLRSPLHKQQQPAEEEETPWFAKEGGKKWEEEFDTKAT